MKELGLRGRLIMLLRMNYRLVEEKTQVDAGRTHPKHGCDAGFVEAQFYCFSWGGITEQWSHTLLSHCSHEQFFFSLSKNQCS